MRILLTKRTGYFNSRPSARGDAASSIVRAQASYFNSRPSARGDPPSGSPFFSPPISIHAPPRGATADGVHIGDLYYISIHAPPRGATLANFDYSTATDAFQFTPLREGRRPACEICGAARKISIHAPPRGATPPAEHCKKSVLSFQFTPLREGRRRPLKGESAWKTNFNSRPSARGDRCGGGGERNDFDFNSRPSARGDKYSFGHISQRNISIHAPPRGATDVMCLQSAIERISIHAPPRGATIAAEATTVRPYYFNSRPSARGDHSFLVREKSEQISIHAPPRGATLCRIPSRSRG